MAAAPSDGFLERYADVAVRVGTNLQPGQTLFVNARVEHVPLARAVGAAGWRAGAGDVQLYYSDDYERYLLARHGDDERLSRTAAASLGLLQAELEAQGASVNIIGDTSPHYFDDADEERLARTRPVEARKLANRLVNEDREAWVVIGSPDASWAERMFGEPDVARLADEIARACRLDEPDPVEAWTQHLARLEQRRTLLTERGFDRIHIRGPGTDLTVGLIPGAGWVGGLSTTAWGQTFCANLPTEEVYTTPHRLRVDGTVRGTRPVSYDEGVLVEGIELRFAGGAVVEARAAIGEDFLRRHLESDAGAGHLGELALVAGSPIGRRGLLFYNTLFDENATSHLAYGMAYVAPVPGASGLDKEAQLELGINDSFVHTDFPIGGEGVDVDGLGPGGDRIPILTGDEWLLA